jgi:hypothetical protein
MNKLFCLLLPLLSLVVLAVYHSTRPKKMEFTVAPGTGISIQDSGGIVASCDEDFKSCNLEKGRTLEDLMKAISSMVDFQSKQFREALKACKEPSAPAIVLKETAFNLF